MPRRAATMAIRIWCDDARPGEICARIMSTDDLDGTDHEEVHATDLSGIVAAVNAWVGVFLS